MCVYAPVKAVGKSWSEKERKKRVPLVVLEEMWFSDNKMLRRTRVRETLLTAGLRNCWKAHRTALELLTHGGFVGRNMYSLFATDMDHKKCVSDRITGQQAWNFWGGFDSGE